MLQLFMRTTHLTTMLTAHLNYDSADLSMRRQIIKGTRFRDFKNFYKLSKNQFSKMLHRLK